MLFTIPVSADGGVVYDDLLSQFSSVFFVSDLIHDADTLTAVGIERLVERHRVGRCGP